MKDFTKFANVVGTLSTTKDVIDPQGSTQDWLLAEAIHANEPTSVLVKEGIVLVQKLPMDVDEARFPLMRNAQWTWQTLDPRAAHGTTNPYGSDISASSVAAVEFRRIIPTTKSANIFLNDAVSLVNKVSFDMFVQYGAVEAARKKEVDALAKIMGTAANAATFTQIYSAGGMASAGSVIAGSTLTPADLVTAKRILTTGSNIHMADFVLVHPIQFEQLNTHADFAPGATARGALMRKAKFNENGDIVKFNGMDVIVSELVPAGSVSGTTNTAFGTAGHWVLVGTRGKCGARAEHYGLKIASEDSRRYHGAWKIFDMSYEHDILVDEANVLIRAHDT